jgi:hypothetical protein
MSEIANGYSWYKFDIDGWLSSPDVQQMSMAERGMYHHLITIQARDGRLAADILALARQAGVDRRVLQKWLQKWGYLFPIIGISPNAILASVQHACSIHVTSVQQGCSMCVAPMLPLCCFPAASWMHACSMRANPKQWNLSVKSGKFEGQPLLEEKREEGDLEVEVEGDWSRATLTLKPKTLVVKGEGA